MRVIKKYGNRRLYDTEASAYINLEGIGDLIRSGISDSVRQAKQVGTCLQHGIGKAQHFKGFDISREQRDFDAGIRLGSIRLHRDELVDRRSCHGFSHSMTGQPDPTRTRLPSWCAGTLIRWRSACRRLSAVSRNNKQFSLP